MWGFKDLKDVLDVLVVPLVIFGFGLWLPRLLEKQKRDSFFSLIQRELEEMVPQPATRDDKKVWPAHLTKRFIHEDIFRQLSENRDFILSLPPELAYNEAQLWTHYDKATQASKASDLADHGASWCDYLGGICKFFDKRKRPSSMSASLENTVFKVWKELIISYHPELETKGRLSGEA
jgi:hypothetical protein